MVFITVLVATETLLHRPRRELLLASLKVTFDFAGHACLHICKYTCRGHACQDLFFILCNFIQTMGLEVCSVANERRSIMAVCTDEGVIAVAIVRQLVKALQTQELHGFRSRQYNRACVDVLTVLTNYQMQCERRR